jgi:hypothetical protein
LSPSPPPLKQASRTASTKVGDRAIVRD